LTITRLSLLVVILGYFVITLIYLKVNKEEGKNNNYIRLNIVKSISSLSGIYTFGLHRYYVSVKNNNLIIQVLLFSYLSYIQN